MSGVIANFRGDYAYLSNFYRLEMPIADDLYPEAHYYTVEHAFQAAKSLDRRTRFRISAAPSPSAAKSAGRLVDLRPDWEDVKIDVMRALLAQKFHDSAPLHEWLLATGDAFLIEGNTWHDNFWGACKCGACLTIDGLNWLGMLLMERREALR